MSSLVLKVGSLLIKTLSKPIASRIKEQAGQHARFRRVCIATAQSIHRWDMRFRLGLLQDTAAIDKAIAKENAEAQAKKHRHDIPTAQTEAQAHAAETKEARQANKERQQSTRRPKIPRLPEAKAIDLGANFVSETFLFSVGVALILLENWRRSQKESNRREDVNDRLEELEERDRIRDRYFEDILVSMEKELISLEIKNGILHDHGSYDVSRKLEQLKEKGDNENKAASGWLGWLKQKTIGRKRTDQEETTTSLKDETIAIESGDATTLPRSNPPSPLSSSVERVGDRIYPQNINFPPHDQNNEKTKPSQRRTHE